MASTDGRPFPIKNTAYRVTFPILDADGDLVTGAAGLDSEVSKDAGTFADCTNEATEIATSSGMYYLDLTNTEMNADTVAVIVKTSTSGAKTTTIVLYPVEGGDIDVDVTYIGGSAVSTSTAQLGVNAVQAGGTAWGSGAITAASIASSAITNAKFASGAIDAAAVAADAIGASELAADAATEIATAVWAAATRVLTANTNLNDPTAAVIADAIWDELLSGHTTAGTAGKGLSDAAAAAAPSAASIADAVWDEALSGHLSVGSAGKALDDAKDGDYVGGSATAATNAARGFTGLVLATAVTGTLSTTAFTTSLTEATNDHYNGRTLTFTSGVLAGQMTTITDYNGTTKLVTVAAMTEAPGNGDAFFIA